MLSIKDLRRAETEIENELIYVKQRMSSVRSERQSSMEGAMESGKAAVEGFISRTSELLEAVYAIRNAVGKFNEDEGINNRTSKIAYFDRLLNTLEQGQNFGRTARNTSYGSSEVTYTPGIDDTKIDELRNEVRRIRRDIQSLKDSCNGINASKDATPYIDAKVVEFLKNNNFIG